MSKVKYARKQHGQLHVVVAAGESTVGLPKDFTTAVSEGVAATATVAKRRQDTKEDAKRIV